MAKSGYRPERHGPHRIVGPGFHEEVYEVVQSVPRGQVASYGDIAKILGSVSVARHVGFALSALPRNRKDVPWHRIVNGRGEISCRADGKPSPTQVRRLKAEGVKVDARGRIERFREIRIETGPTD